MVFTFWSGNLALDFAGTMAHRDTDRIDVIDTPDLLASWVVAAGLLDEPPAVDDQGLERAVRLREAIYRLAVAPLRGWERAGDDVAVLNASAATTPVRIMLDPVERPADPSEPVSAAQLMPGTGGRAEGPPDSASAARLVLDLGEETAGSPGSAFADRLTPGAGGRAPGSPGSASAARLVPDPGERAPGREGASAMRLRRTGGLENVLASVARSGVELLGGPDAARIRQCEREPCTRLYVDLSRGSTRRWCDMRECGNREKAATFRSRRRPTAGNAP
jgi:predicted RNA-binding Zn ribbon-like protein